jgi:hypothetical protein
MASQRFFCFSTCVFILIVNGCAIKTPAALRPSSSPLTGKTASSAPVSGEGKVSSELLGKPKNASVIVRGHVAVDPRYVLAAGTGSLVSNNGGSLLAAGNTHSSGASLVANNGGNVIANNSGNVAWARVDVLHLQVEMVRWDRIARKSLGPSGAR